MGPLDWKILINYRINRIYLGETELRVAKRKRLSVNHANNPNIYEKTWINHPSLNLKYIFFLKTKSAQFFISK